MADQNKQPSAPPPSPAPAVPHDKSAVDDFAKPYVQIFIANAMRFFADHRAVERLMGDLGPLGKAGIQALPGAVALAVRKMPDSWFKNPELAHFIRDIIRDGAKDLSEILKSKGEGTSIEDIEKAVKDAERAAMDLPLILEVMQSPIGADPVIRVHVTDCARVLASRKPAYQNPRNQNQQAPQPSHNLAEIKLKDAIAQGLKSSTCCAVQVKEAVSKAEAAPKSFGKNRSPLEIVGSIKDEELKKSFKDWLNGLSKEDRMRALDALRELNSEGEFYGFMAMDPANRVEFLPLLEDRNASHAVRKHLGIIGAFVKNGWKAAAEHYTRWDASLAPEVARLQRKYHDEQYNVTPYKKPSWGRTLKSIFSLNPFQ